MTEHRMIIIREDGLAMIGDFSDELRDLRDEIECDTLDMPTRFIEGRPYVFICDDCGLI